MLSIPITALLIGGGLYRMLLGFGKCIGPERWRGHPDVAVLGRVLLFLGILMLPTCFGYSLSDVRDGLEDIWTSGGGAGTG